jgi:phage-related protein
MSIKVLIWLGDSLDRVRMFATEGRQEMGFELWEIQQGKEPSDSRPMASVGLGVQEIRVSAGNAYRAIYVAKFPEAVYVLHAFEKQSRKTAKSDLDLARTRFKALVQERKRK